jgi:hypothetical protein
MLGNKQHGQQDLIARPQAFECVPQTPVTFGDEHFLAWDVGRLALESFDFQRTVPRAVAENAKTLPARSRGQPGTDTTRFAHVIKMFKQLEPGCLRHIRRVRISQAMSVRDRADQAAELPY